MKDPIELSVSDFLNTIIDKENSVSCFVRYNNEWKLLSVSCFNIKEQKYFDICCKFNYVNNENHTILYLNDVKCELNLFLRKNKINKILKNEIYRKNRKNRRYI